MDELTLRRVAASGRPFPHLAKVASFLEVRDAGPAAAAYSRGREAVDGMHKIPFSVAEWRHTGNAPGMAGVRQGAQYAGMGQEAFERLGTQQQAAAQRAYRAGTRSALPGAAISHGAHDVGEALGRSLPRPGRSLARAAGRAGAGVLRPAVQFVGRSGMAGVFGLPFAAMAVPEIMNAGKARAGKATMATAASMLQPSNSVHSFRRGMPTMGGHVKLQSAGISVDDVRAHLRIRRALEKQASKATAPLAGIPNDTLKKLFLYGAAVTGVGTALGVGGNIGGHMAGKAVEKVRATRQGADFTAMLKADPGLKQEPQARAYFNVVHRASPYLASEPVFAAATVRSMIEYPGLDERKLQSILQVEKARQDTRFPFFHGKRTPGFGASVPMPKVDG